MRFSRMGIIGILVVAALALLLILPVMAADGVSESFAPVPIIDVGLVPIVAVTGDVAPATARAAPIVATTPFFYLNTIEAILGAEILLVLAPATLALMAVAFWYTTAKRGPLGQLQDSRIAVSHLERSGPSRTGWGHALSTA